MYTLDEYKDAMSEFSQWSNRWDNYSGNNPDKYQSNLRTAREKVRRIESYLKNTGLLPLTEQEALERQLDVAFPNAKSKEIVEFEGKKYIRCFFPLEKSRSRITVTAWGKAWEEVTG